MKKEKEVKEVEIVEEEQKYPHKSLQVIEDNRSVFWKSYKIHNTLKLVVMMFCLAAIVVACLILPSVFSKNAALKDNKALTVGVPLAVGIVAIGGTYGYSLYVRKKFDKKLKEYFSLFFNCINEYVFEQKGFSDVELQTPGKITLDEFNECKLYKDVIEAGSRGLTTYKFNKLEMSIVDCAGNVKADKRIKPVFVGKMVRAKSSYEGEKPIYVYLKGNERSLPPTNLDEIKAVLDNDKMYVRTDYKDWKKVLNSKVLKAIEAIKVDKILVDVALSIYGGKVYVMMGYDDPLMVMPLQTEFVSGPFEGFKKDLLLVSQLVEALNK